MKILVLMPLDERWSYIATELWKHLDEDARDCTFAMPMFTEWQMATKRFVLGSDLPPHWNVATFGTLVKAREVYHIQEAVERNLIIIGNIDPDYKFDAVFNFQDVNQDLPYQDHYLDKLSEAFKNEPSLVKYLHFYPSTASTLTLHNIEAAAAFLSAYVRTDVHLDEVRAKYQDTLHFKESPHVK